MSGTLVLIPTKLERDRLEELGGLPGHDIEVCGFGPISAAARTAQLAEKRKPTGLLLLGIAGVRPLGVKRNDQSAQGADRLADLLEIQIGDLPVTDGGDCFSTFLDGVDGGGVKRLVADEMTAEFLADVIQRLIADLRLGALQRSYEPLHRIGLDTGEDTIDLAR